MKISLFLMMLSVAACAAKAPKSQPLTISGQKIMATYDPDTGKVAFQNGADAEDVIGTLIGEAMQCEQQLKAYQAQAVKAAAKPEDRPKHKAEGRKQVQQSDPLQAQPTAPKANKPENTQPHK